MEKKREVLNHYEQALQVIEARLSEATKELEQPDENQWAELEAEVRLLQEWKAKVERLLAAESE